jgi:uncharacterized membrane protein YfcA
VVLALLLISGGVIGAQFGALSGERMRGEEMRILLAGLVMIVAMRFAFDLVVTPDELYSFGSVPGRP